MSAARFELLPAAKREQVLASGLRFQVADLVKVNDSGAVNPHEPLGVKQRCEPVERTSSQKTGGANANVSIVARRFDEINLLLLNQENFAVSFY